MEYLNEHHKKIVERVLELHNFQQVATEVGLTRERVRQIAKRYGIENPVRPCVSCSRKGRWMAEECSRCKDYRKRMGFAWKPGGVPMRDRRLRLNNHCKRGHAMAGDNVGFTRATSKTRKYQRYCKTCHRDAVNLRRQYLIVNVPGYEEELKKRSRGYYKKYRDSQKGKEMQKKANRQQLVRYYEKKLGLN
jgi:hypothetical protein